MDKGLGPHGLFGSPVIVTVRFFMSRGKTHKKRKSATNKKTQNSYCKKGDPRLEFMVWDEGKGAAKAEKTNFPWTERRESFAALVEKGCEIKDICLNHVISAFLTT